MSEIHEEATVTSKGQIMVPRSIRQALGVSIGGKVAFDLRHGEVIVTRADEAQHEDPAIGTFLGVLERDIRAGRRIHTLPDEIAKAMLADAGHAVNLDEPIDGEVTL